MRDAAKLYLNIWRLEDKTLTGTNCSSKEIFSSSFQLSKVPSFAHQRYLCCLTDILTGKKIIGTSSCSSAKLLFHQGFVPFLFLSADGCSNRGSRDSGGGGGGGGGGYVESLFTRAEEIDVSPPSEKCADQWEASKSLSERSMSLSCY